MAELTSVGKHQWPSEAPPCRTSTVEECMRCGLLRKSVPGPTGLRWYWRYSRDGVEFSVLTGPCGQPAKKVTQVLQEVRAA